MKRSDAIPYVSFVVDDSGNGRELGADLHAVVRESADNPNNVTLFTYPSVLVGWQCGFEPLFVAVHSYLDVRLDDDEAEDLARDYLEERGWFSSTDPEKRIADYVIR